MNVVKGRNQLKNNGFKEVVSLAANPIGSRKSIYTKELCIDNTKCVIECTIWDFTWDDGISYDTNLLFEARVYDEANCSQTISIVFNTLDLDEIESYLKSVFDNKVVISVCWNKAS